MDNNNLPQITLSTCWYELKSKFSPQQYAKWIHNFVAHVSNNFFLVIYTDKESQSILQNYVNKNSTYIKIVLKPLQEFVGYAFKDFWIHNHNKNNMLNTRTEWTVNMMWSEKVHFVAETYEKKYFPPTPYYGWCDIGYFRHSTIPLNWGKTKNINPDKIYYALVNTNVDYINNLYQSIQRQEKIPPNQISIAGGFFLCLDKNVIKWQNIYMTKLQNYIKEGSLVKDDQIIIIDCIFSQPEHFQLIQEPNPIIDEDLWFPFQSFLL